MKISLFLLFLSISSITTSIHLHSRLPTSSGFGRCRVCVEVLKEMRSGESALLPNICSELLSRYPEDSEIYPRCNEVIYSISEISDQVRTWILYGCWKKEIYNEKEHMLPCPFHVICSKLIGLDRKPYCATTKMDNPFVSSPSSSTSNSTTPTVGNSSPSTSPQATRPQAQSGSPPPTQQQRA